MKNTVQSTIAPQVALLLETSTEYGRGLLRGILRYSRLHGPWSLFVGPGHLSQGMPSVSGWKGDGIISRTRSPKIRSLIRSTGLPFVASSLDEYRSTAQGQSFGEILTDPKGIARTAAEHLVEAGFRRMAFCGFANCKWSDDREKAFLEFANEQGFPCSVYRVPLSNWWQRPNWIKAWRREQPNVIRWLQSLPKPVGLMACNDVCGREVLQACQAASLQVPEEIAVVGVDNDELICELSNPALSSVELDLEGAGYEAAKLLARLMGGEKVRDRLVRVEPTHVVARRSSDVIAQEDSIVAGALRFIRQNVARSPSVSEVAEHLGVSRRTMERRFFDALGRTVLSEILRCRVQRAKQLLMETNLSCSEIAAEAGFASQKTFHRTFREKEGITPLDFRRQSRISDSHLRA